MYRTGPPIRPPAHRPPPTPDSLFSEDYGPLPAGNTSSSSSSGGSSSSGAGGAVMVESADPAHTRTTTIGVLCAVAVGLCMVVGE